MTNRQEETALARVCCVGPVTDEEKGLLQSVLSPRSIDITFHSKSEIDYDAIRVSAPDVVIAHHLYAQPVIARLVRLSEGKPVIVLDDRPDAERMQGTIAAGAHDYIYKDNAKAWLQLLPDRLFNAIRQRRDLTKLSETEEKLLSFSLVATKTENMVILSNKEGVVEWVNEAWTKISGYAKEEVIGTRAEVFANVDPSGPSAEEYLEKVVKGKQSLVYEAKRKAKDGSIYWTLTNLMPIVDDNEELIMVASINSDITTRKQTEENLKRAKEKAEESEKAKELFLANMTHELRTPMNAITGFIQLLDRTPLTEKQEKYLRSLNVSSDSLLGVINDILDFSKIEAGMLELEHTLFQPSDVLDAVEIMLGPRARERGLDFVVSRDSALPGVMMGDPTRLKQILVNLVSNAVKFTEEGKVEAEAMLLKREDQKVWISFTIADTGIGISQNKLGSIFSSFTQAGSDTTRKYGGTGLGLSIVSRLVEIYGGEINVESELDKGTTFTVTLPFKEVESAKDLRAGKFPKQRKTTTGALKDVKILVGEDNKVNRFLIKEILDSFGCEAAFAENGQGVLEILEENEFDVILLDLNMPVMNGIEATLRIRSNPDAPQHSIPIIAMSAHARKEEIERCKDAGMNDYIAKPFEQYDLYRKLAGYVLNIEKMIDTDPEPPNSRDAIDRHPLVDLGKLFQLTNRNKGAMVEVISMLMSDMPETIDNIRDAIHSGDFEQVRHQAHSAKSGLLMIRNQPLYDYFRSIEKKAEQGNAVEELETLLAKAHTMWEETLDVLEKEKAKLIAET